MYYAKRVFIHVLILQLKKLLLSTYQSGFAHNFLFRLEVHVKFSCLGE